MRITYRHTIRSREISASIILQSQSQLKAIYRDAGEIISDNCDCTLFLSGRGKNAKEIADVLGKETIDSYNQSENRGAQTSHGLNYQKLGKDFRYRPYEELQAAGLAVDRKNYALVYTAPLDGKTTLEDIYRTFNADDRPAGFRGHSLSVSDVVVVNRGGKEEAHYCDSIGFTPVPEFMRESPIKTAEMSTEQNYNMIDGTLNNAPSMGELEARARAGEQISLFDVAEAAKAEDKKPKQTRPASKTAQRQKKPSIRAQLKAAKEEQAKKPPQREKSKELEV